MLANGLRRVLGITTPAPVDLSDHERLMRHTGRPECPIPEHADALRLLGRAVADRDHALDTMELVLTSRNAWRTRDPAVESRRDGADALFGAQRLHHPHP
jgi:hypothetical protein